MVTIITGEINSGKTTKMKSLYSESQTGYDLVSISQNDSIPFIREKEFSENTDDIIFNIGKYNFLEKGFLEVEKRITRLIDEQITPIYIDELGMLELQQKCFYKSVVNIMKNNVPLITCVRTSCLKQIIELFNFSEYRIIEV